MRDDFNLIIDLIADNSTFASDIMRVQDNFSRNSLHLLTIVRDDIAATILEKHPLVDRESATTVANYLSGLHAYEMRQRINYLKKRLPHFSKWFVGAMSANNVAELFDMDTKLNDATQKVFAEILDDEGNVKDFDNIVGEDAENAVSDFDKIRNKISLLDFLKTVHCKSNRTVADVVKKHFGIDELSDASEILKSNKNAQSVGQEDALS